MVDPRCTPDAAHRRAGQHPRPDRCDVRSLDRHLPARRGRHRRGGGPARRPGRGLGGETRGSPAEETRQPLADQPSRRPPVRHPGAAAARGGPHQLLDRLVQQQLRSHARHALAGALPAGLRIPERPHLSRPRQGRGRHPREGEGPAGTGTHERPRPAGRAAPGRRTRRPPHRAAGRRALAAGAEPGRPAPRGTAPPAGGPAERRQNRRETLHRMPAGRRPRRRRPDRPGPRRPGPQGEGRQTRCPEGPSRVGGAVAGSRRDRRGAGRRRGYHHRRAGPGAPGRLGRRPARGGAPRVVAGTVAAGAGASSRVHRGRPGPRRTRPAGAAHRHRHPVVVECLPLRASPRGPRRHRPRRWPRVSGPADREERVAEGLVWFPDPVGRVPG